MADALNYISVDDLSAEIQKHCDHEMLPSLLAELRGKQAASRHRVVMAAAPSLQRLEPPRHLHRWHARMPARAHRSLLTCD